MTNSKTLLRIHRIDLIIICDLILLSLVLYLVAHGDFDVKIQNNFFDFVQKKWLVDKTEPVAKFFFYHLPKIILAIVLFSSLLAVFFNKNRQKFLLIFLGLALIPMLAGNIKKITNVYCPYQLAIYDGDKPYVKIFEKYPENFSSIKSGKCFPAGHAITGFAFFILCFALAKKSHKFLAFFIITIYGWVLGSYQMLKGAHFFGDTLVAMLTCFLIAAIIARIYETRLAKTANKA